MSLANPDKKQLRAIGHSLKPVVTVAQKGLSDTVRQEIERALTEHELIKIKLQVGDRDLKAALVNEICADFSAEEVQTIGHVLLLYRAAMKPDERLSNISRAKSARRR